MKAKILILGLCWFAPLAYADTDPRVNSPEECAAFADLALVASTLAKHGIDKDQSAKMLPDMYELDNDNSQEIARRILDTAYGQQQAEPRIFAGIVGNSCIRHQGRFNAVLGAKI